MALVWHWSHPSTPAGVGWDLTIDGAIALVNEKGIAARAALGEAEVIRLIVDDPTGSREYKTLHRIYAVEDETPGDLLVWNGYISDQWEDAGEDGDLVYPYSTGRRWELEITQENTLLGFRVIRSGGDRPAESPGARLLWLLNSDFLKTVYDHGLIDWSALDAYPDMTPSNYTDQTAADVLRSISHWTGFNHYIRYRDASSDIELAFYNPNTNATLDLSSLKISGAAADLAVNADGSANYASNLIWPPSFGTTRLHRKGDRVAAGVLVRAANNISSYDYSLPTSYEFGFRDIVVTDNTVTTQAGADRLRDRLLEQHDEQDERVTTRIQVPAANLNSVMHGQLIEAKFPRFTDWTSFRKCRVVSKSFGRPDNETQAVYDVDLELSPIRAATCETGDFQALYDEEKTPVMASSQTFTVPAPTANPSVIVAVLNVESALISVGPSVAITTSGAWNPLDSWSVPLGDYWHEVADSAYQPYSGGTPENLVGTLAFVEGTLYNTSWTVAAVAVDTASTTPVQNATSSGPTSGNVTLSSAPTPGNILVMFETVRGHEDTPPYGWTLLDTVAHTGGTGGGTSYIYIFTTCVPAEGMSATITVQPLPVGTERHSFVSEWAPI